MWKIWRRLFNLRGDLGSLFGGKNQNQVANIQIPQFQQNQSFNTAQNNLATLGTNILSGNLPSYYSSLGNPNSQQFQNLTANVTGQANAASAQQAAASGTDRSGVAATAAAGNLANVLPNLDYQNYLNAQQQQQGLLSLGTGVTQDVAQLGLTDQSQVNSFNQQNFQDQFAQAQYNNQYNQNKQAQEGAFWGNSASTLFGQNVGSIVGSSDGYNGGSTSGNSNGMMGNLSNFFSSLLNSNNGYNSSNTMTALNANPSWGYSPSQFSPAELDQNLSFAGIAA